MKFGQLLNLISKNNKEIFIISENLPEYCSLGIKHGNFIRIKVDDERLKDYSEYEVNKIEALYDLISVTL